MKWFSWSGISNEIKRIRWPSRQDLASKSGKVLLFVVLFALFFVAAEFVITWLLKWIGVVA